MYLIGIYNKAAHNDIKGHYLEGLRGSDFSLMLIEEMDSVESDIIILCNDQQNELGKIYEQILTIKKQTNSLLCVYSEKIEYTQRMVYLQLGVDFIIDPSISLDEWKVYLLNAVKRKHSPQAEFQLQQSSVISTEITASLPVIDGLTLNPQNISVVVPELVSEVSLTNLEFRALQLLVDRSNEAVSYEEMITYLWQGEKHCGRTRVANLIFHIRKKIEEDLSRPKYIRTVRSKGYLFQG